VADRPCKHADICGLSEHAKSPHDGEPACILHLPPSPPKDAQRFSVALAGYLERGGCDFRWMYFPDGWASFEGRHFGRAVDFRDTTVMGTLTLTGATFEHGVVFGGAGLQKVDLSGATVRGDLTYSGRINSMFLMNGATALGATVLRFDSSAIVGARQTRFDRNVVIEVAAG
jgi:hypothetical protein